MSLLLCSTASAVQTLPRCFFQDKEAGDYTAPIFFALKCKCVGRDNNSFLYNLYKILSRINLLIVQRKVLFALECNCLQYICNVADNLIWNFL